MNKILTSEVAISACLLLVVAGMFADMSLPFLASAVGTCSAFCFGVVLIRYLDERKPRL